MSVGEVGIDDEGNLWYDKSPSDNVDLSLDAQGNLIATYDDNVKGELKINPDGELEVIC